MVNIRKIAQQTKDLVSFGAHLAEDVALRYIRTVNISLKELFVLVNHTKYTILYILSSANNQMQGGFHHHQYLKC